jgi:hypothetical protein
MNLVSAEILGKEFQLGSYASNTIYAGGPGQEPHVDYPYWDLKTKPENWTVAPRSKHLPFTMNMQVRQ